MGSKPSSFAVYKNDYDELVPQDMRKDWGRFHYTWAIRNVIGAIDKWRPYHGIEKPIEYIFDWEKPGTEPRKEIEDVMEQAEEISGRLGLYTNYTFHKRRLFPGLHCVDTLGWVSYQTALNVFCKKPMVPDAKVGWQDFRRHDKHGWRVAGTIKRTDLERLVREDKANSISRRFYDEWRSKKAQKKRPATVSTT